MIDRLICVVLDYEWGDLLAIPTILGIEPTGEPQAEMWMGANFAAPSQLEATGKSLLVAIAEDQVAMLGQQLVAGQLSAEGHLGVQSEAGFVAEVELPYLLKFLAAGEPLSIQVHPNASQAQAGYQAEHQRGIDKLAPNRTYRDSNHKPELVVALQPFSALCGFRSVFMTRRVIELIGAPELEELGSRLLGTAIANPSDEQILASTVEWLLNLDNSRVGQMVRCLTEQDLPDSVKWAAKVATRHPDDVGVLVGLLLNHALLEPGEGIFLPAGSVHAYLGGVAIELMANSDNVIRCGLTNKHIDRAELFAVANFSPSEPPVQQPTGPLFRYASDASEFGLTRIELNEDGIEFAVQGPEIVVVTEGSAKLHVVKKRNVADDALTLVQGQVAFISADEGAFRLSGTGLAWRATVGD